MRIVFNFVALVVAGYGSFQYAQARAAYDPEAICAKQQDMPQEQCLGAISTAFAGGF